MGITSKLIPGRRGRSTDDYVELDLEDFDTDRGEARMQVHIAEIREQRDIIPIKDAILDGNMVIADITRLSPSDSVVSHIIDDLDQVVRQVDGDIVQKGDDQLIVTPASVKISREKLD
jgi:SepF-like predicted cell division protein (DUF552 family)